MASHLYTAAHLQFDEASHTSKLPDGRNVPHVTTVLSKVCVTADFEDLADVHPRVRANIEFARARGSAVHADCHAYDDDDLDLAQVDERLLPHVEAWIRVREAKRLTPVAHARERLLYHPVLHYCGRMDGVFMCDTGARRKPKRILVDIKNGDPDDAAAHLQTAAYEAAWMVEHPDQPIDERWAVWLRPDRAVPYTIIDYSARPEAPRDFGKFCACLTVYNEQPGRRARIQA